ncbi:hypothetical protein JHK87_022717 [Glycine soja]|nr:hypothetical protein JHK87_022717 [Glycine soja]
MDSFQQQPHGYMRPPQPPPLPPHTADPHHHPHHFHQIPPPPPQVPWFSSQFQYRPSQTPSPPPQWQQPPPAPPSNAYSYHPNQFPPPRAHVPPPQFTPHSHVPPQPYPQEWGNPNWPPNQGYPANKNEDWAAKARAWADANAARESQHPQSHFSPAGRMQEQSHYHDQYQLSVDSHYTDVQNQTHPSASYQQFSYLDASVQRISGHSQEPASASLEASYNQDGHSCSARNGTGIGDSTVSFEQGNLPTNPSVHQQEVPSSYSSVAGNCLFNADCIEWLLKNAHCHTLPKWVDTTDYRPVIGTWDCDEGAQGVNKREPPLHYLIFKVSLDKHWEERLRNWMMYVWVASTFYVKQLELRIRWLKLGNSCMIYGLLDLISFLAPHCLTLHLLSCQQKKIYSLFLISRTPYFAPSGTWCCMTLLSPLLVMWHHHLEGNLKEETFVNDGIDKSYARGDEADSKSIDSSRSAEDEEDEEDQVEAARTAAINLEIKRVLTEVLLKVTDELFDEIATKVLAEDDFTAEVGHKVATSNHKASASPPSATVPKASAKVFVPIKEKVENVDASEKSNSSSPGDVLGLGNYGSDADDGDNEIESSSVPTPAKDAAYKSGIKKPLSDTHDLSVNGISQLDEHAISETNLVNNQVKTISLPSRSSNGAATDQLHDDKVTKESNHSHSSKVVSEDLRDNGLNFIERNHDRFNGFSSKDTSGIPRSELPGKNISVEKAMDDHSGRESRKKSEKNDRPDRSTSEKDFKRDKTDYGSEAKERVKQHSLRHGEKAKESDSRKRSSHVDVKDDKKEAEKSHRGSATDDTSRKREHAKDKGEHKSRQKDASNNDRHRRRRSSSVSSRGRTKKDCINHAGDSSGEGSDGSKRKLHSRKRDLSPSPVRSKRRQLLRSPHSKRSQRRHSPYTSLDSSRLHIYVTMVPSFLLEPFYAGEGGQDPDHLFGGRDEWMGTEMVDFASTVFIQENINLEA